MLVLIGLDFGRVYLGYINVQNMARIACQLRGEPPGRLGLDAQRDRPDAVSKPDPRRRERLQLPPARAATPVVPPPVFTDTNGDGSPGLGDTARVQINCTFTVITPLVSNIVGGAVAVSANRTSPSRRG